MNEICVVYYDLVEIPAEILSIVNIDHYGSLHYKKQKLVDYHQNIFKENEINLFIHIKSIADLQYFISYYSLSNIQNFIFFPSSFAIVDPKEFSDFIKRIKYIDGEIAIANYESIRSFLRIGKKSILALLEMLLLDNNSIENIINQNFQHIEKFRKETFYLQISSYIEFIKFLHSNFELRYFNSLLGTGLVITKTSTKKLKMLSEFKYYEFVPEPLKMYFLRPFDYQENKNDAQYSLEQLNIPDLSIQWIHFSLDINQFTILLERIFNFLKHRPYQKTTVEQASDAIEKLYVGKLNDRFELLKTSDIYAKLNAIISNCTKYNDLENILEHYKKVYLKLKHFRKGETEQHFGHGDLCFSNILYDKRIDYIKFIDPKGCTTQEEAYFDKYYDLAKLSHSILGNYDFINNGIFNLNYDNDLNISLKIEAFEDYHSYQKLFQKHIEKNNFNYQLVRIYEASLFLSMLPLHIDYPKKVLAFILIAIQILEELDQFEP